MAVVSPSLAGCRFILNQTNYSGTATVKMKKVASFSLMFVFVLNAVAASGGTIARGVRRPGVEQTTIPLFVSGNTQELQDSRNFPSLIYKSSWQREVRRMKARNVTRVELEITRLAESPGGAIETAVELSEPSSLLMTITGLLAIVGVCKIRAPRNISNCNCIGRLSFDGPEWNPRTLEGVSHSSDCFQK